MQEVLAEKMQAGNGDLIKDVRCWEQSKTWGYLQKQVCADNEIVREMVREDKRDKMVNRIQKMHMHQLQLIKENEIQRQIRAKRAEEKRKQEEERSMALMQFTKKRPSRKSNKGSNS